MAELTGYRRAVQPRCSWLRFFGIGLLLWLVAVLVTYITANPLLIPTVVLLGSFLVPAMFVYLGLRATRLR